MFSLISYSYKPNRLIPENQKDEKYHLDMARFFVSNCQSSKYWDWYERVQRNKNFATPGGQWKDKNNLENFLFDSDGNDRNREPIEINHIIPMVNQYIGNVASMTINARAKSFSPMVKTRKDTDLEKYLFYSQLATMADDQMAEMLRSKLPIGKNEEETKEIFENTYVDKLLKAINNILAYGEVVNEFNKVKKEDAEDLATSGLTCSQPYVHSGEYKFKRILPERVLFDRAANEYDASDAACMGFWDKMLPEEVYERFQDLKPGERQAMEEYTRLSISQRSGFPHDTDGRIPVFYMYWRDTVEDKWGYVKDEFGQVIFVRIGYTYENEEKPRYTEKDLIPMSDLTSYQKRTIRKGSGGKSMSKTYTDNWRYCAFIPSEVIGSMRGFGNKAGNTDIALEYGVLEYQEEDLFSPSNMKPPLKINQYMYVNGETYSPVDIAITPQILINRFISVFQHQVNNSGGAGLAYDSDMLDMKEDEFLVNSYQSKPIKFSAKGMPIQNAMTQYDNTISKGTISFLEFTKEFKNIIDQTTGVNDAMKGQTTGSDQLVGVTQMMTQKGNLIQQRFYEAIAEKYKAQYQALATAGKRLYIDNKKKLADIIGDDSVGVVELSKSLKLEDFRIEVTYSLNPEVERATVDQKMLQYLQIGMIDQVRFANLVGRSTMDELNSALREYAKEKILMQRNQAEQQQQQAQQITQEQQQQMNDQRQFQLMQQDKAEQSKDMDRQNKLHQQVLKNEAAIQTKSMEISRI